MPDKKGSIDIRVNDETVVRRFKSFPAAVRNRLLVEAAESIEIIRCIDPSSYQPMNSSDTFKVKAELVPRTELKRPLSIGDYDILKRKLSQLYFESLRVHIFKPLVKAVG